MLLDHAHAVALVLRAHLIRDLGAIAYRVERFQHFFALVGCHSVEREEDVGFRHDYRRGDESGFSVVVDAVEIRKVSTNFERPSGSMRWGGFSPRFQSRHRLGSPRVPTSRLRFVLLRGLGPCGCSRAVGTDVVEAIEGQPYGHGPHHSCSGRHRREPRNGSWRSSPNVSERGGLQ